MSKLPETLELTDAEFDYLALNVKKLKERRDKFPDKFTEDIGTSLDKLNQILVIDQLKSFKMLRRERRLLQIFFNKAIEGLEKHIIPGYKQRMITPKSVAKYDSYWKAAKERKDMLIVLVEKLEMGL